MLLAHGSMGWFQSTCPFPIPRCHFPMAAVAYPFCCSVLGRVGCCSPIMRGASPGSILALGFFHGYIPVNMPYRLGVEVAEVAYPLLKHTPLRARESMWGVQTV